MSVAALLTINVANAAWCPCGGNNDQDHYDSNFYARLSYGLSAMPNITVTTTQGAQLIQPTSTYKLGQNADLAGGYIFNPYFRMELAGGYIYNELDENYLNSGSNYTSGGHARGATALMNAYFDYQNKTIFTPYIGAGAGYIKQRMTWQVTNGDAYVAYPQGLAMQGIAGFRIKLIPELFLTVDYRHLFTPTYKVALHDETNGVDESHIQFKYATNLLNIGLLVRI